MAPLVATAPGTRWHPLWVAAFLEGRDPVFDRALEVLQERLRQIGFRAWVKGATNNSLS